jgi:hypothetical protein
MRVGWGIIFEKTYYTPTLIEGGVGDNIRENVFGGG